MTWAEPAISQWELDLTPARARAVERHLSGDERRRADGFATPVLRRRFVAARGQLRERLGALLGVAPADVPLDVDARGKPFVAGAPTLCFSVAHSAHRAVCAIAMGTDVGVDIEWIRPLGDVARLAALVFAEDEVRALSLLDGDARTRHFHLLWVCKEAVCKAEGRGLALDPRSFTVPHAAWLDADSPGARAPRVEVHAGGRAWLLERRRAVPPDGFAVAWAVARRDA